MCAKRVEGCSEKSIRYYKATIEKMSLTINKEINKNYTEYLRRYLFHYYTNSQASVTTVENIKRILSSFFSWIEEENYILKIKSIYSDENIGIIREL
ncbi:phage integrase N-terminal SAM-like domain-containing protein [Clostridium sp.]|uniref:phage integrase N-terminal SAM-like domain-containing protein n=1 Tax=Clostridium sp. TaxID=1506 RepID=UPI0025C0444E|nr:phage integrase N-terminal SAM-like domain-containing protein [Clostridium sp.]